MMFPSLERFDTGAAAQLAWRHWGLRVAAEALPGERDRNFRLDAADGRRYVLKLCAADEDIRLLECQHAAMERLAAGGTRFRFPRAVASVSGETIVAVDSATGGSALARLLEHVPGIALARVQRTSPLLRDVGVLLGTLTRELVDFDHPATDRALQWDLRRGRAVIEAHIGDVRDAEVRTRIERMMPVVEVHETSLAALRTSVIHGDANDHNILAATETGTPCVSGIVDFGDLHRSWTIGELAIGCAYAMLDHPDPIDAAAEVVAGYHAVSPLPESELPALFPLICLRLCVSAVLATHQRALNPSNTYLSISEAPVHHLLALLQRVDPHDAHQRFRNACTVEAGQDASVRLTPDETDSASSVLRALRDLRVEKSGVDDLLARRRAMIAPALSVAYRKPLHIVRGWMQYLYASDGRAYLDAVNNVAHVGHCHPRVVAAAHRQSALLNTNTRYLHELLVEYAERLTATLPDPLRVCTFVCSGSEANELALRMARAHTGRRDVIVLDGAYHGNTTALIELSPYKFNGPGGSGRAAHVHVAPLPDPYRGVHRGSAAGQRYADEVRAIVERLVAAGTPPAAFFAEPLPGCGGQVVPPDGFLRLAMEHVRAAGGVCIADEVQTGLGRVGTHFWAFETQGARPDIVTVGKPIGNGHPLAAVITTPEIAASFANGMEYFNTFGGNPVSCAVGLAVLDVIRDEALQENARVVGDRLLGGLRELHGRHEAIGDVRGRGLYIGVELVRDRTTRSPAGELAGAIVNAVRDRGVLISTDGPNHNVLKIKPPLVFTADDADRLVEALDDALNRHPA